MDKKEVLASYLNLEDTNEISFDYDNYYSYGDSQYLILKEGDEEYEYLKEWSDELIEQDQMTLQDAGFGYLIEYIHFDELYENDSLLDHDFELFTYKDVNYFIRME